MTDAIQAVQPVPNEPVVNNDHEIREDDIQEVRDQAIENVGGDQVEAPVQARRRPRAIVVDTDSEDDIPERNVRPRVEDDSEPETDSEDDERNEEIARALGFYDFVDEEENPDEYGEDGFSGWYETMQNHDPDAEDN